MSSRRVRKGPGRRPMSEKRRRFLDLLAQGWTLRDACRELEIHRSTGQMWKSGTTVKEQGPIISALRDASAIDSSLRDRRDRARTSITTAICAVLPAADATAAAENVVRALGAFELLTQLFDAWIANSIPHDREPIVRTVVDAWSALLTRR